jgi:hypothetical protein
MNNLNSKLIKLLGEIMFSTVLFCFLFFFLSLLVIILRAIRDINEVLDLENKIKKKAVSTEREL